LCAFWFVSLRFSLATEAKIASNTDYLSFLNDPTNVDMIRWSDDGNSIIIIDESDFAKTLIPKCFKHSNFATFVRQANQFGFRKRMPSLMDASGKSRREFENRYFKRDHPDLVWLITDRRAKKEEGGGDSKEEAGSSHEQDFLRMTNQLMELQLQNSEAINCLLQNQVTEFQATQRMSEQIRCMDGRIQCMAERIESMAERIESMAERQEMSANLILNLLNRHLQNQSQ